MKKIYIFGFLVFFLSFTIVHALTSNQKGAILENFKKKQYELLFDSNLGDFSSEFGDIFSISKKADIYDNIGNKVSDQRADLEVKYKETLEKITSLEESIKQLDIDIENTSKKVYEINRNVISTKKEYEENKQTITKLKKKVIENNEILLDYLTYIYKKSNTIYNDDDIDNLKSILLNGDNISDVIDDLYYKGLIQVTGKKLIDNYRKDISDLYLAKVRLEKQESNLKSLRKMSIIEKKVLNDKKSYKDRILTISKGKQSYYNDYISDKIETEKAILLKSFQEKVKLNNIRDGILDKYGCNFVDISKNTAEVRALDGKCLDINKMIYSESQLSQSGDKSPDGFNFFSWPITPDKGISRYYHDPEYKKDFGSEHEAIDIVATQGTSIKAPADGYVIYIDPPTSEDYAYVALKHYDGYITVYGHISDVFVKQFDYVKKGQIFAQTGGEYGTLGAGYLSTGPHLHFEVFKNKKYLDPFTVLDLSYIKYANIPEKYRFKFFSDFKNRTGSEYEDKSNNSRVFKLKGDNEIDRQKYLINTYAVGSFKNWDMWVEESLDANIDPSFVMCIGLAETTLGKYLKTPYNIGNIGNTDSGATKTFPNARSGLYWMVKTLNNKYLSQYDEIKMLSRYGNKDPNKPIYASDPVNWHRNIIKCMSHLKGNYVPDDYNFRILD